MYFVYVIENLTDHSWYIGFTTDVARRVEEHISLIGGEYTKKRGGGWRIIYIEGYLDKKMHWVGKKVY